MRFLGIDEAGRGPVLGNLVLAGVIVDSSQELFLKELGVQDSKIFGSSEKGKAKRCKLAEVIRRECPFKLISLSPQVVDEAVYNSSLNKLEQLTAEKIIQELSLSSKVDKIVLDGEKIFAPLCFDSTREAHNKGDSKFISIAAASILAKVERDQSLEQTFTELDGFAEIKGGGYPNSGTFRFLVDYFKRCNSEPSFLRKSYNWKLWKDYLNEANQM